MKTQVVIFTYKRPEMLQKLLGQLAQYDADVIVFDDDPDTTVDYSDIAHYIAATNHGKRQFWLWVTAAFVALRGKQYDRYVFLPDDFSLCKNFLARCEERWSTLPSGRIALNLLVDHRAEKAQWTGEPPVRYNELVEETWWFDGCFYAERSLFEALNWEILPILASRWTVLSAGVPMGSGVWCQASQRLHQQGLRMFRSWQSLVFNHDVPSMMNPVGRAAFPPQHIRWIDA